MEFRSVKDTDRKRSLLAGIFTHLRHFEIHSFFCLLYQYLSDLCIFVVMKKNPDLIKGSLSTIILELLSQSKKMYGYEMVKKVKEHTGKKLQVTEGALYPALHKLEADGLIESTIEQIGNRPRKYYHLTQPGKKERIIRKTELEGFVNQLHALFNFKLA